MSRRAVRLAGVVAASVAYASTGGAPERSPGASLPIALAVLGVETGPGINAFACAVESGPALDLPETAVRTAAAPLDIAQRLPGYPARVAPMPVNPSVRPCGPRRS